MAPLSLPGHVHFCVAQGHGVFLDLHSDAYAATPLPGSSGGQMTSHQLAHGLAPHLADLREEGLVRCDDAGRALDSYQSIPRCTGHVVPEFDRRMFGVPRGRMEAVRVSPGDVASILMACRRASRLLRENPIAVVVQRAVRRSTLARLSDDSNRIGRDVIRFAKVRPWYPRDYLCLFDAVALLEFLAARGLKAKWMFGVQAQPFAAHCWLQVDHLVVNDNLEYCNQFTPIMSV